MELHQLRYFLASTRTLNFTKAAELCHVSQPALTTAIRKLEEEFGSQLFHREGKRLLLSEFGRMMAPRLALIVEQTELARGAAESYHLLNQVPLQIGVLSTIGPLRLGRFLSAFEHDFPGVEVAVHEDRLPALLERLSRAELDALITNPLEGPGDGYRVEPLYRERYIVLLPPGHRLVERDALSLKELSGEAYVDRLACEMREMVMRMCDSLGVTLYARFRSEREDWVQAMVLANMGFAFMPEYSVTSPETATRLLTDPPIERTVSMVTMPGRKYSPALAAMVRSAKLYRWLG